MAQLLTLSSLLLFITDLVTIYIYNMILNSIYKKRRWTKKHPSLFVLFLLFDFTFLFICNMVGIILLNSMACIVSYLLLMYCIYDVKNQNGILFFLFYFLADIALESFIYVCLNNGYSRFSISETLNYGEIITPLGSTGLSLGQIIIAVIISSFAKRNDDKRLVFDNLSFALIPFVSLIIFYLYISLGYITNFVNNTAQSVTRISVFVIIVNFVVFVVLEKYASISKEKILLAQDKISLEAQNMRMESAAKLMKERLEMTEERLNNDRIMRHDRRHFEAMLLNLLEQDKKDAAIELLKERMELEPRHIVHYCDNSTINAVICHYDNVAKNKNIKTEINLNIPSKLDINDLNFAVAAGNLFENAINACERLSTNKRYIKILAQYKSQLLLEIENPCNEDVTFDENGYPTTSELGHGVGTKSILEFVNSTDGDIKYSLADGVFKVRMIING